MGTGVTEFNPAIILHIWSAISLPSLSFDTMDSSESWGGKFLQIHVLKHTVLRKSYSDIDMEMGMDKDMDPDMDIDKAQTWTQTWTRTQLGIVKSKFNGVKRKPLTALKDLMALKVNCQQLVKF